MVSLKDLTDALILGGTGIGIVLVGLTAFMLVMMALTRFFPGESEKPPSPTPEAKEEDPLQAERKLAAAIAVSMALTLHNKTNVQHSGPTSPASKSGAWKLQGRANLMVSRLTERDGSWR